MATHNKITEEIFNKIKAKKADLPADDALIAEEFGVGISTARTIRLSKDYEEYRQRSVGRRTKAEDFDEDEAEEEIEIPAIEFEEPEPTTDKITIVAIIVAGLISALAIIGIISVALHG